MSESATTSSRRQIRFWCSPESASHGEISVLAIVETVVAMLTALWLVWASMNWLYVAVPATLAPLLLLRTKASTTMGLALWEKADATVRAIDAFQERQRSSRVIQELCLYLGFAYFLFVLPLFGVAIRVIATVATVFRHPINSICALPENWWRIALATDFHHPPERVPGTETSQSHSHLRLRFSVDLARQLENSDYSNRSSLFRAAYRMGWFLQHLLIYGPALIYRWSLKSTTLVWAPLVWASYRSKRANQTAYERLESLLLSQTERLLRWYSGVIFLIGTVLPFWVGELARPYLDTISEGLGAPLIDFWVFTGVVRPWHAARWINIAITFVLLVLADAVVRRKDRAKNVSESFLHNLLGPLLFVRVLLGAYLGVRLLIIVVTAVDWQFRW